MLAGDGRGAQQFTYREGGGASVKVNWRRVFNSCELSIRGSTSLNHGIIYLSCDQIRYTFNLEYQITPEFDLVIAQWLFHLPPPC